MRSGGVACVRLLSVLCKLLMGYVYKMLTVCFSCFRFWMDHFPEDFKLTSALTAQLLSLQTAMRQGGDHELLELITSDSLSVVDTL